MFRREDDIELDTEEVGGSTEWNDKAQDRKE